MAIDLAQIQSILANAEKNETLVSEIRKAAKRVESALGELNVLLADDYTPAKKERKTRTAKAPKELGAEGAAPKKPGRPARVKTEA